MKQKLIFDVGYNRGAFSTRMHQLYSNIKIIGVEGYKPLVDQFYASPKAEVTLLHNVVSHKNNEEIIFGVCDINPDINTINPDWVANSRHNYFYNHSFRKEKVKSITLDHLIETYGIPDIIKLDIEGAEYMALLGLTQKVGIITFEFCVEMFHETIKCINYLKNLGYSEFAATPYSDHFIENLVYTEWEHSDLQASIYNNKNDMHGMIYCR